MSTQKFKNGDKAVINSKHTKYDAQNYGVHEGMEVQVVRLAWQGYYEVKLPNGCKMNMASNVLDKESPKTTKEKFLDQIKTAESKIKEQKDFINETKDKLKFMEETGSELFIENEFKAFRTLTIIEQSDMSKIEKAKAIASLITNK